MQRLEGDLQHPSWASCWWQPVYIGVRSRAKGLSRRGQGFSLGHTQPINRLRGWWQMPNSQEGTPLSLSLSTPPPPPPHPEFKCPSYFERASLVPGFWPLLQRTPSFCWFYKLPTFFPSIPLLLKFAITHFHCMKPEPRLNGTLKM